MINDELSNHSHAGFKIMKQTGKARSKAEGSAELAKHYIYAHNIKD